LRLPRGSNPGGGPCSPRCIHRPSVRPSRVCEVDEGRRSSGEWVETSALPLSYARTARRDSNPRLDVVPMASGASSVLRPYAKSCAKPRRRGFAETDVTCSTAELPVARATEQDSNLRPRDPDVVRGCIRRGLAHGRRERSRREQTAETETRGRCSPSPTSGSSPNFTSAPPRSSLPSDRFQCRPCGTRPSPRTPDPRTRRR